MSTSIDEEEFHKQHYIFYHHWYDDLNSLCYCNVCYDDLKEQYEIDEDNLVQYYLNRFQQIDEEYKIFLNRNTADRYFLNAEKNELQCTRCFDLLFEFIG